MLVEHIGLEASQARRDHILGHIRVDGQDGQGLHEQGLCLAQQLEASLGVQLHGGGRHEPVVLRVAPAGLVVLAAGDHQVHEGVGVAVVPNPGRARHVVAQVELGVEVDLPLLVAQLRADAKGVLPGEGDDLRDGGVRLRGVVVDLDRREALAAGEARLGQEAPRLLEVPLSHGGGEIGSDPGGREAEAGLLTHLHDLLADLAPGDHQGQRAPDARVVVGGLGDIDPVEVGPQVGRRLEVLATHELLHDIGVHAVDHITPAGQIHVEHRRVLLDGEDIDRAQGHAVRVPIGLVLHESNAVVHAALGDAEGAVGDDVLRPHPLDLPAVRPARLRLLQAAAVHGEGGVEPHEVDEERGGGVELDLQHARSGRADAQQLGLHDLGAERGAIQEGS